MMDQSMLDEMNEQIMHEMYSAYLYLAMSAHMDAENWPGFASWLRVQAQEELEHAMKIYEFILDRGGRVVLHAIAQPPTDFQSHRAIFEQVYEHEQQVTARIHHMYDVALKGNDYPSQIFLQWFIDEQVEEEKNSSLVLEQLRRVGESMNGLFMLDHRLGKRSDEE